ncbi:PREDICTED: MLO-like protein 3 isoform X2 [Populus euphratica]|uniref:MLO-like protein n=1 Tax=Populus euphratica TaxID=75702 RepID=A0AAJ6VHM5_POPEU|nr:PREDICTED: MLO-like protein 3 isoform X2 [Populus euphratica]
MAAEDASIRTLEHTPTWALATVCFVFISVSCVLEHIFHLLTNWLNRSRRTALGEAVNKLKSELMLLGFMSLMLAVTQKPISKICIPANLANSMLPCRKEVASTLTAVQNYGNFAGNFVGSLSLENGLRVKNILWGHRSLLADDDGVNISDDPCSSKGKVSLISEKGIQQLHKFIFVLAVMHIVYGVLTMALGWTKMRRWEAWEKESRTTEYQVANDPNRFRLTRQTTFGRRHIETWTKISPLLWMIGFLRQFFNSVAKVDYLTLRHGFISAHLSTRNVNHFNFQEYIQRSLDDDFKAVVSISPLKWFLVVIFLLLDVHGWNVYHWISYVPLVIVLVVGAKLEVIVAKMAFRIDDQNCVSRGTPLVQPNDNLFWFGQPRFVLVLIHFVLFVIQFGLELCYHENTAFIVARVVLA